MPRAGSGWYYNLIHDLVVAHGGQDARLIRERYRLERFLTEVNCNLSTLKPLRLIPVQVPSIFGNRFVIKTLSAYEYGQNALSDGRRNAFSHLTSLDSAAEFMLFYVKIWEAWSKADGVLIVKYEQLVRDFYAEFSRLAAFLGIEAEQNDLSSIHDSYRPDKGDSRQKGMHFNKGQVERFREVFSPTQLQQYTKYFEPYLEGMGYA
jgi:hypothetical protein